MSGSGQGCCTRCGAALRRVRPRGEAWCDPCRRAGPDPRRDLPPGFSFQDPIAAALADYDFSTVFRQVRAVTGWSQQTLGNLVGLDQGRISAIKRCVRRLRDVAVVAQVATALCIPPVLLGFGDPGTTVGVAGVVEGRKVVSWMDCLANIQARAHAAKGDAAGCDRALGQAVEWFTTIDSAPCESWGASFLNEAHLAGFQGEAHYELALVKRDSRAAGRAVPLLRDAVDRLGPDYARPRARDLTDLAGAHALAGDADTAVTVGHQAFDAVMALHSPRTHDQLRVLSTALEPLHTSTGVAELRDRLTATVA